MAKTITSKPVHHMSKRSDAEKKLPTSVLSPFNERVVNVAANLSSLERDLYQWLISTAVGNEGDLLFSDENVVAIRSELNTLQSQIYLNVAVVNAWTCHLNFQERFRSRDSSRRFFFTTFPCLESIVDTPPDWSYESVFDVFSKRIEAEMAVVRDFKIGNIDMVFFPICDSLLFYVLVFDMRRKAIVLLDNSSSLLDKPLADMYGDVPMNVVKMFCGWLIKNDYPIKGNSMIKLPIKRLKNPLGNDVSKVDSGVYAMRHMELFMGLGANDRNCGLIVMADKLLHILRVKYCKTLLTTDANHKAKENLMRVEAWTKGNRHVVDNRKGK